MTGRGLLGACPDLIAHPRSQFCPYQASTAAASIGRLCRLARAVSRQAEENATHNIRSTAQASRYVGESLPWRNDVMAYSNERGTAMTNATFPINDRWRLSEDGKCQWILEKRKGERWYAKAYCGTKAGLLEVCATSSWRCRSSPGPSCAGPPP